MADYDRLTLAIFIAPCDMDCSFENSCELRHAVDLILVGDIRESRYFVEEGVEVWRVRGNENPTVGDL